MIDLAKCAHNKPALRRQHLVGLDADGWRYALASAGDSVAVDCLAHWAGQQWPLVVTQQPCHASDDMVSLGLPAPQRWGRCRIAVRVPATTLLPAADFPTLASVVHQLAAVAQSPAANLLDTLQRLGVDAHVYGGFGWQQLTGMRYVHAGSDVDIRLAVLDGAIADLAAAALHTAGWSAPRLDGELLFPDGSAVAWREWRQWRSRAVDAVLVKRLHGVALERNDAWLAEPQPC